MVALFVVSSVFVPAHAFAMTQEEINTERIALIDQLIVLLQARVAELEVMLQQQLAAEQTNKAASFGSIAPAQIMTQSIAPVEVQTTFGSGDWKDRQGDDNFRNGMVKFSIIGEYKKAILRYHQTGKTPTLAENGYMDLAPNGVHGYFLPNTEYTYNLVITDVAGKESHVSGTFTTGNY